MEGKLYNWAKHIVVAISTIATEEYVVDFIVVGDSAFAVMVVEHTKFVKKLNRL